eukprot:1141859-Pelagomonas_calceolata.AAC.1
MGSVLPGVCDVSVVSVVKKLAQCSIKPLASLPPCSQRTACLLLTWLWSCYRFKAVHRQCQQLVLPVCIANFEGTEGIAKLALELRRSSSDFEGVAWGVGVVYFGTCLLSRDLWIVACYSECGRLLYAPISNLGNLKGVNYLRQLSACQPGKCAASLKDHMEWGDVFTCLIWGLSLSPGSFVAQLQLRAKELLRRWQREGNGCIAVPANKGSLAEPARELSPESIAAQSAGHCQPSGGYIREGLQAEGKGYIAVPAYNGSSQVAMGFDLQPGSLAARPAQLFQLHKKYP